MIGSFMINVANGKRHGWLQDTKIAAPGDESLDYGLRRQKGKPRSSGRPLEKYFCHVMLPSCE